MLPSKGSPNVPKKLNWKIILLKNIYGWSALYRAKYFLAFRPPKTLVNSAMYLFASPPFLLFSPPPDTYFLTLTQLFSLSTCCNTNPTPPFAPPLSHGRQNKTAQNERCGEKEGKRVYSSIPFLFFSFSCLFVLPDEITKEEEKRRYNYKEGRFHETLSVFPFFKNPAFLLRQ